MPTPATADARLNSLLSSLIDRLAGSGSDTALVHPDDRVEIEDLAALEPFGLITPAEPARSAICAGCDQACLMEVIWPGRDRSPFIVCDKRDDIGSVAVDPCDLRRWSIALEALAHTLASLMNLSGCPQSMPDRVGWQLGKLSANGTDIPVRLVPSDDGASYQGLTVSMVPRSLAGRATSLAELLNFRGGQLVLDREALASALPNRSDKIALEIKYVARQIVLLNHVTNQSRTLAKPDFNSVNDNVFQMLIEHPGRTFTLDEVRSIAHSRSLRSLSRIPEKLNFRNHLRTLFFEVSKSAIRFKRTVTVGELQALAIDPISIG